MIDFLSHHAGLIGLLFFFTFFSGVVFWAFRPGSKKLYTTLANIPFKGGQE